MCRRVAGAATLIAGLAACGGSSSTPSNTGASVGNAGTNLGAAAETIKTSDQLRFDPRSTTAHVGDVIQWSNPGTITHTITFDSNQSLSDSSLDPGGTWQVKFTAAGTYQFHCSIHTVMTGTITVT
jgi:plastocyanin